MTLTSKIIHKLLAVIVLSLLLGACLIPVSSKAQLSDSVVLSVSPTLFDMTANEGQSWTSNVRVINANPFPITIYADPVHFEPQGEAGLGSLTPIFETEQNGQTLAEWIEVTSEDITVPAEQTLNVPFTISVPEGAEPGGHFAAIMIGTRSTAGPADTSQVETSQVVTALVFLRVAGDIRESGTIREFSTSQKFYEAANSTFQVRFENNGNVHLQPQGEIVITNMWGRETGLIPINRNSQFGNTLPESIREYTFNWNADWSLANVGRHTAVVTLAYGDTERQFTNAVTHFWVIPWRVLLLTFVIIGGLLAVIVWGIRTYIRRMLEMAGVTPELQKNSSGRQTRVSMTAPLEAGMLDLRKRLHNKDQSLCSKIVQTIQVYKVFSLVLAAIIIFLSLIIWYVWLVTQTDYSYDVEYKQPDGSFRQVPASDDGGDTQQIPTNGDTVVIVNQTYDSDIVDMLASRLQSEGFQVEIEFDPFINEKEQSVLVYHPDELDILPKLQSILPGVLVSSYISSSSDPSLVLYIGTDLTTN